MIAWGRLEAVDGDVARYRYTQEWSDGQSDPEAGVLVVPHDDWTAFTMDGRQDQPLGAMRVARKASAERAATGQWPQTVCWFSC